jgi:hypothetical protein
LHVKVTRSEITIGGRHNRSVPLEPFSRRSFLALAGGAVLLAACGGDDDATDADATTTSSTGTGEPSLAPSTLSSDLYASSAPQRFAFLVQTQQQLPASSAAATVSIAPPSGQPGAFTDAPLHREGLPDKRGVYVLEPVLAVAGVYTASIKMAGETLELPFQVKPRPEAPAPGTSAPVAPSATVSEPLGVNPLCTREPQCPLHDRSLSDLIGKGRPVAVMFATPALCQTQFCGPVLDQLLPLADEYRDRIDFVHVEIYRDSTATDVASTVNAWGIPSEPWLFGVDAQGKVTARLDGAFASDEIRAVLEQLAR